MSQSLTWPEIETDLRIGLLLISQACGMFLGGITPRAKAAKSALLGVDDFKEWGAPSDMAGDAETLNQLDIKDTDLFEEVSECFISVSSPSPLQEVFESDRLEILLEHLDTFLASVPRQISIDGPWPHNRFQDTDAPLPRLRSKVQALLDLAEYARCPWSWGSSADGFYVETIAALADINPRTVRNVMSPTGKKSIKSVANRMSKKFARNELFIEGDALDTLEWLAGRRNFNPGGLSPDWVTTQFQLFDTMQAAAAVPGIVGWINRITTDAIADRSGWTAKKVSAWIRGKITTPSDARQIAMAVGLDPDRYEALIERLSA